MTTPLSPRSPPSYDGRTAAIPPRGDHRARVGGARTILMVSARSAPGLPQRITAFPRERRSPSTSTTAMNPF
jgi:hypothetical protein